MEKSFSSSKEYLYAAKWSVSHMAHSSEVEQNTIT